MHSAKLLSYVDSPPTLQLDLSNMKLDKNGVIFVNKICRKKWHMHILSIKLGDSVIIKKVTVKYRIESVKYETWAAFVWHCLQIIPLSQQNYFVQNGIKCRDISDVMSEM